MDLVNLVQHIYGPEKVQLGALTTASPVHVKEGELQEDATEICAKIG